MQLTKAEPRVVVEVSADTALQGGRFRYPLRPEVSMSGDRSTALDNRVAPPEDWWSDAGLRFPDLGTIVVHALVETAVHAGDLYAVRELLDGRQHLVL